MKSITLTQNKFCEITVSKIDEDEGFILKPKIIPHYAAFARHESVKSEKGKDVYTVVNYLVATHFEIFILGFIFCYKAKPIEQSTMFFNRI